MMVLWEKKTLHWFQVLLLLLLFYFMRTTRIPLSTVYEESEARSGREPCICCYWLWQDTAVMWEIVAT